MFSISLFCIAACNKFDSEPEVLQKKDATNSFKIFTTETDSAIFHYRFNDSIVQEGAFVLDDSTLHFLLTDLPHQYGKSVFVINAFTTKELLVDFCSYHSIPINKVDSLENELLAQAIKDDLIEMDTMTQAFEEYVDSVIISKSLIGVRTVAYNRVVLK